MEKSLFIGNGFTNSQILFLIPIAHGYSKKMNIKVWIFEFMPPDSVLKNQDLQNIFANYHIKELNKNRHFFRVLYFFKILVTEIIPLIKLVKITYSKKLGFDYEWFDCQLQHSIWDQELQSRKDGSIYIKFYRLILPAIRVLVSVKLAKYLVAEECVVSAFLGHTVYSGRGLLAELNRQGVDIICHGNNVLYRAPITKDVSWSILNKNEWSTIFQFLVEDQIEAFWKTRKQGNSNYLDASNAALKTMDVETTTPKNLILLHVFKDSPFNCIDRSRIFFDYIDWVRETLYIISTSEERWIVKFHPSASRWGEDQRVWINALANSLFDNLWPTNIEFSEGSYSNIDLFNNVHRVVTYQGTSHLEAACFGIKPIIISNSTLSSYDTSLVLKPKTLAEYSKLLLKKSNSEEFRLLESEIYIAKKLLYIREEILSFGKDIRSIYYYRGDDELIKKADFESVLSKVGDLLPLFSETGEFLANGLTRSISLKYIKIWGNAYDLT
ncbi:MAG: hypothetical protein K9J38_12265 [Polynucleobacter sp.]|nr:hypothetical protein [Polynucleobacter sp.]